MVCVLAQAEHEVQEGLQANIEQLVESMERRGDGESGIKVGIWRGEFFMRPLS